MNSKIRKSIKGFTIVEVMIVMAIAGLILLIVFLAVPALQRNSRNTQRRNDVANILAAINEYSTNNQGRMPADTSDFQEYMKQGFYETSMIDTNDIVPPTITDPALEEVRVYTGAKCNTDGNAPVGGAGSRAVAAFFSVESSGDTRVPQCQEG